MSSSPRTRLLAACAVAAIAGAWSPAGAAPPQTPVATGSSAEPPRLRVVGAVATSLDLDAAAIAALPHRDVRAIDSHGRGGLFRGVDLVEILRRAGAAMGEAMR